MRDVCKSVSVCFFFFQAEDGIRDSSVTGVQTCALPILFVNAAGCMTLLAVYPFTPFRGSWLYTAMASAPAGAQGVRDALDILLKKGPITSEGDLETVG